MSRNPLIERLNEGISDLLADPEAMGVSGDDRLMGLLNIARDLRELPRPDFKDRLKADLERNITMPQTNAPAVEFRPGFRTVTPYLVVANADFVDFVKNVFGGVETHRTVTSPATFHAEVRIGDSMLMIAAGAERVNPAFLSVFVPDVDTQYKRALDAGCRSLDAPRDSHGVRFAAVEDAVGNQWVMTRQLGSNFMKENFSTVAVGFTVSEASRFVEFLKNAVNAEELHRVEWPGGFYAEVRIGSSVVTVSETTNHEWMKPLPTMLYLYVPDADASYNRALRAGAKSISPVADQPYGDRQGGVQDAWGYQWFFATPL